MLPVAKDKIKVAMGNKTLPDCLEEYRAACIRSMRFGGTVCFDLDKVQPNFKGEYTSDAFPAAMVFDKEAIRKKENWSKILKEEENFDRMNTQGNFDCADEFAVCFLISKCDTPVEDFLACIPGAEKYQIINIG